MRKRRREEGRVRREAGGGEGGGKGGGGEGGGRRGGRGGRREEGRGVGEKGGVRREAGGVKRKERGGKREGNPHHCCKIDNNHPHTEKNHSIVMNSYNCLSQYADTLLHILNHFSYL